jgi:hypothetical protein
VINLYKLRISRYVIFAILFTMLLIGCKGKTVESQPNIPIISTRVGNTPTRKTTEIIEIQPTDEIIVSKPENEEEENQKDDLEQALNKFNPNLIIHTVKEGRDECIPVGKGNAWTTQSPYVQINSFLSSDNTNILKSSWSPNGEWIAYIESKPSTSAIGEENPVEDGTDQVWIIRPDGTGKRAVGEALISADLLLSNYCVRFQYIFPDLFWSPDSRYIIYPYIAQVMPQVEWVYLLYDLETENLLKYRNLRGNTPIEWSTQGDQLLMVKDDGSIIVTQINSGKIDERDSIDFPQADANYFNEVAWGQDDQSIIALISFRWKPGAPVYDSIWEFELSTREWSKKFDYQQLGVKYSENMFTNFGKTKAQIWSTLPISQFYILDFKTWVVSGPFPSITQEFDYIQTKWVMVDNETEFLMFVSAASDHQVVGVSNFIKNNMQSRILIDLPRNVYGNAIDFPGKKKLNRVN